MCKGSDVPSELGLRATVLLPDESGLCVRDLQSQVTANKRMHRTFVGGLRPLASGGDARR
jgi:hypothetical protein